MKLLIIGGTVFLGRALVDEALRRGDEVTLFNRGRSGPAPSGVEVVRGDREDEAALRAAADRTWDGVIDTCGFEPRTVQRSVRARTTCRTTPSRPDASGRSKKASPDTP
ncbi:MULTISPECIES: NAD-dependent epimerase/dehydratase family protein [unclassified Streptomyces]|uniref:NAD-dependent epimerase/dehydratase family protein n=1 Tax=unclassified Streptomyces TaxID=2593676 RepID=UPI00331EB5CE